MPSVVRFAGAVAAETSSCRQSRNVRVTILGTEPAGYSTQEGIDDLFRRSFGRNLGARRLSQIVREGIAHSRMRPDVGPDCGAARVASRKLRISGYRSDVPHRKRNRCPVLGQTLPSSIGCHTDKPSLEGAAAVRPAADLL